MGKNKSVGNKSSNDKPEFNFGLPGMDDLSIRRVLFNTIPHIPRNYVIMEVKANLCKSELKEILDCFPKSRFNRVAHVVMGEPQEDYKVQRLGKMLEEKQAKADAEWKVKKDQEKRKKQAKKRQKQLLEMRKKAEEAR